MSGDPAIRWQTMRDLLDLPEENWQIERGRTLVEGWGAKFLATRLPNGTWDEHRWTGTVWTLTLLTELGLPARGSGLENGFGMLAAKLIPDANSFNGPWILKNMDLCHLGFWLRVGAAFNATDARLPLLSELLIQQQMGDGGWNCRRRTVAKTRHGSFHTTINVLEGLREAAAAGCVDEATFRTAESGAVEFMLQHRLYRSDRIGEVINERFLDLTFPSFWHYTLLRGLDYVARTPFCKDSRLEDPLDVIRKRRKPSGLWPVEKRQAGVTHFDMEQIGRDSRWNTLRALRVFRAYD